MENIIEIQMRKNNMKIYPMYKMLSWDTLFYSTISFLFLTQVKSFEPADIVLLSSINAIFGIIFQIPAVLLVQVLKRRDSLVIANLLKCINMLIVILCNNYYQLILAYMLSAFGGALKGIVDPSILNESIPPSKFKEKIFSNINSKGASRYYLVNAITVAVAGILYEINPYIPIILSFITTIIVLFIALQFKEPIIKQKEKKSTIKHQYLEAKKGFQFVFSSERLKALILFVAVICGLYTSLSSYEINLVKEYETSSALIGIIFAILGLVRAHSSRVEAKFHNKFRNKTLTIIGYCSAIQYIIAGIIGVFAKNYKLSVILVVLAFSIRYITSGVYYTVIDRYFRNFTNEKIDTKIFAAKNLCINITTAIIGLFASILLKKMSTENAMILVGSIFLLIFIAISKYMKTRLGLKPNQYSKQERMYDDIKNI